MSSKQLKNGFTLIELMIVVVVVAIFSLIALPTYQSYARNALESQVQQQMLNLATRLERHKARNFNYKNFDTTQMVIPTGATGTAIKYTLEIRDGDSIANTLSSANNAPGRNWSIRAEASKESNFNYLLTSRGTRCKNKTKVNVTFAGCVNAGTESW